MHMRLQWRLQKLPGEHLRHRKTAPLGCHGADLRNAKRRNEQIGQGTRAAAQPSPFRGIANMGQGGKARCLRSAQTSKPPHPLSQRFIC
jgi:hypothetical protein